LRKIGRSRGRAAPDRRRRGVGSSSTIETELGQRRGGGELLRGSCPLAELLCRQRGELLYNRLHNLDGFSCFPRLPRSEKNPESNHYPCERVNRAGQVFHGSPLPRGPLEARALSASYLLGRSKRRGQRRSCQSRVELPGYGNNGRHGSRRRSDFKDPLRQVTTDGSFTR